PREVLLIHPRRSAVGFRLRVGENQRRSAWGGSAKLPGDRSRRPGGMAGPPEEGTDRGNVPAPTRAEGDDPKAGGRRETTGHPDDSGPGGANRRQAGAGADLGSGSGAERLRLPPAAERARRRSEGA